MKIAVMGSGGVGGFYGGRLAHAGYDVHFVARGAHLEALRKQGLTIENKEQGDIHVAKVNVTDDPATIGTADVVIIAVKLKDTDAAAQAVKSIVGPQTAVLSLQNGVIKDDILRKHYSVAQIMGGVAYVATHVARPGVILQVGGFQRVVFGEYHEKVRARRGPAQSVAGGWNSGGVVRRYPAHALGKIHVSSRLVGHDDHDALDHRTDPHESARTRISVRPFQRGGCGRAHTRRETAGELR